MAFTLKHIRTGKSELFTLQVLLEMLGDSINDEIVIKGEAFQITSVKESGFASSDWQKQVLNVTSNGQNQFEIELNTSDPEGLFLVVNGALFDYGQNGAFHIDGTTLYWHGQFGLEITDMVYLKYLSSNN